MDYPIGGIISPANLQIFKSSNLQISKSLNFLLHPYPRINNAINNIGQYIDDHKESR
jgi:hypothetical protein